jgi:hypothetical protein
MHRPVCPAACPAPTAGIHVPLPPPVYSYLTWQDGTHKRTTFPMLGVSASPACMRTTLRTSCMHVLHHAVTVALSRPSGALSGHCVLASAVEYIVHIYNSVESVVHCMRHPRDGTASQFSTMQVVGAMSGCAGMTTLSLTAGNCKKAPARGRSPRAPPRRMQAS